MDEILKNLNTRQIEANGRPENQWNINSWLNIDEVYRLSEILETELMIATSLNDKCPSDTGEQRVKQIKSLWIKLLKIKEEN